MTTEDTDNLVDQDVASAPEGQLQDVGQQKPDQAEEGVQQLIRQNQDLSSKLAVLEGRLSELSNPSISDAPVQTVEQFDLGAEAEQIFKEAIENGDSSQAAKRFEALLNNAGRSVSQQTINQFMQYQKIQDRLRTEGSEKKYVSHFKPQIEQRIAQYLQAGHSADKATDAALKEFETHFSSYESEVKEKKETNAVPNGARSGITGQVPPVKPPPPPAPDTPHSYVNSRLDKQAAKFTSLRV